MKMKHKYAGGVILLSALIGTLLLSETTSPLYSDWGYDSAMFQTIGKYWAEGYLPYVSLFDHKGPIIFFINALGYALCGRTGVFIIQVLNIAVTEFFAFKLLKLRLKSPVISLLLALLFPFILAANWQEGNTTEEYILPLLFASYYLMLKWQDSPDYQQHPAKYAFVYGMTFAFAVLTRVTNALGVCLGVMCIVVILIKKRQYRSILINGLYFILGMTVLVIPFSAYFAWNDALYDMWYGTLLFNLDYYSAGGIGRPESLKRVLSLMRLYLPGWCLIFAAIWANLGKTERKNLIWLVVALFTTAMMYTMNSYDHYGICLMPFGYIALAELSRADQSEIQLRLSRVIAVIMCVTLLVNGGLKVRWNKTAYSFLPPSAFERYPDDYSELTQLIPTEERDSFVAFDCPRRMYLDTGLRPCFRFFTLQQWMSMNSDGFAQMIHDEFDKSNIQWVMTFPLNYDDKEPCLIQDILDSRYAVVSQSEHGIYKLYHLDACKG